MTTCVCSIACCACNGLSEWAAVGHLAVSQRIGSEQSRAWLAHTACAAHLTMGPELDRTIWWERWEVIIRSETCLSQLPCLHKFL